MNWTERADSLLKEHLEYHDVLFELIDKQGNMLNLSNVEAFHKFYHAVGFHFYKHAINDIVNGAITVDGKKVSL